jgi:3-deoxy-D-manno-octulosonic-acid transferase
VCAIFRENHRFFKWYGSFFRKTLKQFDFFYVQTKQSLELLASIGIEKALLVGDMRFDRVISNKEQVKDDSILTTFKVDNEVLVIGSSWSVDEAFLVNEIKRFSGKIILAPHDISTKHLEEIENRFDGLTVRYSHFNETAISSKIIILDCIGKLANAYSYGDVAYVGGGFSGSLHNILEPAVFGLPVIFGPKHKRFPEAQAFIDEGIGFSVDTPEQLSNALQFIQSNKKELREKTRQFVFNNTGVVDQIHQHLVENGL